MTRPNDGQITAVMNFLNSLLLQDGEATPDDPETLAGLKAIAANVGALAWVLGHPHGQEFFDKVLSTAASAEARGGRLINDETGEVIDIARALATGEYPK